jgi:hypothetical protein
MTNHPNRSQAPTTFTAYSVISGSALADGATAQAARELAMQDHHVEAGTVEVLGFRVAPPSIDRHTLVAARRHGKTAIRATFYDAT